jgi:DNA-binding GntR family transcriptional regulator
MPARSPSFLFFDDPPVTLADQAYRALLEDILTLRLEPGQVLAEDELRQRLGLGRTPIREALQRLDAERLVVTMPRRGTLVSEINVRDLTEVYEIRMPLEGLAARLAAERFAEGDIPAEIATDLAAISETDDLLALLAIDIRLHKKVHRMARNELLEDNLEQLTNLLIRGFLLAARRQLPAALVEEMAATMADFHDLFAAIAAHDGVTAEQIAVAHAGFSEHTLRSGV